MPRRRTDAYKALPDLAINRAYRKRRLRRAARLMAGMRDLKEEIATTDTELKIETRLRRAP